ncbi:hypothetical protein B0H17DRAFT_1203972 [Mycena rosella]|uniref:Uncharacterized protein n=1 Tax=Mycena rosella TaxID=1033263 RepID=A0AAD7DAI9_MYCRO|nr:hypothetical protein B0H17DRAFT_1203972 [Mycena rosella]
MTSETCIDPGHDATQGLCFRLPQLLMDEEALTDYHHDIVDNSAQCIQHSDIQDLGDVHQNQAITSELNIVAPVNLLADDGGPGVHDNVDSSALCVQHSDIQDLGDVQQSQAITSELDVVALVNLLADDSEPGDTDNLTNTVNDRIHPESKHLSESPSSYANPKSQYASSEPSTVNDVGLVILPRGFGKLFKPPKATAYLSEPESQPMSSETEAVHDTEEIERVEKIWRARKVSIDIPTSELLNLVYVYTSCLGKTSKAIPHEAKPGDSIGPLGQNKLLVKLLLDTHVLKAKKKVEKALEDADPSDIVRVILVHLEIIGHKFHVITPPVAQVLLDSSEVQFPTAPSVMLEAEGPDLMETIIHWVHHFFSGVLFTVATMMCGHAILTSVFHLRYTLTLPWSPLVGLVEALWPIG